MTLAWPTEVLAHLRSSGLSNTTIEAAQLRLAKTAELPPPFKRCNSAVLVFPYFDTKGTCISDYHRVRLVPALELANGDQLRYLQPSNQGPRAYLPPPPLVASSVWADPTQPLIITEGEKKALAACQAGFPTLALAGVDSFHSRTLRVPTSKVTAEGDWLVLRVESDIVRVLQEQIVPELLAVEWRGRTVTIVYDSDATKTANENVARAAFDLALWLESRGAQVQQLMLPAALGTKVGLDDYLVAQGPEALRALLLQPQGFPIPHHLKAWVQGQLNSKGSRSRTVQEQVSRAILASLDALGTRYRDRGGNCYYFDRDTRILHSVVTKSSQELRTRFSSLSSLGSLGALLRNNYGIDSTDAVMPKLVDRLLSQPPIAAVELQRVTAATDEAFYYQLSDSRIVRVRSSSLDLVDNGTDGVLFAPGQVQPIVEEHLCQALQSSYDRPSWLQVLRGFNFEPLPGLDLSQTYTLMACLFHLSPWLRRWRGLMLPIEFYVGEATSGKTSLQNLRRGILIGSAALDNQPHDIRDWYAKIAAAPGAWICDNLGGLRSEVLGRVSDEMARLVTDPDPQVSQRELYTTSSVAHIRADCCFVVTSLRPIFTKPDVLQRAVVFTPQELPQVQSSWLETELRRRVEWVACHLLAIQQFLRVVEARWSTNFASTHRLVHLEQALTCMGIALGFEAAAVESIVRGLVPSTQETIAFGDPVMEALRTFAIEWVAAHDTEQLRVQDIVNWVHFDVDGRFMGLRSFDNAITLGKYLRAHKHQVQRSAWLVLGRRRNATYIRVDVEAVSRWLANNNTLEVSEE